MSPLKITEIAAADTDIQAILIVGQIGPPRMGGKITLFQLRIRR